MTQLLVIALLLTTTILKSQNLYTHQNAASMVDEKDRATGWNGPAEVKSDDDGAHHGQYLLVVKSKDNGNYSETGFSAEIGKTYLVSIWARRGEDSSNPLFGDWSGFTGFTEQAIQGQGWKEYIFTVTAVSQNPKIRVYASKNSSKNKKVYIDAISVILHGNTGGGSGGGSGGSGGGTGGGPMHYTVENANLPTVNWQALNIYAAGVVGIGIQPNANYRLSVNGRIRAKEVVVESGWADYVFAPDYHLPTLSEVETHIKTYGHLKDIPSAEVIQDKGVEVGEMNKLLLQKIEELTLYMIETDKRQAETDRKIEEANRRIAELEAEVNTNKK